ncbi:MAG: gliding motility-associated C-terminal domain-containing protein, partial [Bacteroidales bacterium]|nr:gliding motility-associated C-terminal domain-containing protein [Bacteroidales bacterium]
PDGDGLNETIKPVLTNCMSDSYEFIIFDRWGKMVFRTTEINHGWDGIYNGKMVSMMTTFVYTIHYSDIMGTPHQKVGSFTLLP